MKWNMLNKSMALILLVLTASISAPAQTAKVENDGQGNNLTQEDYFNTCSKKGGPDSNAVMDAASIFYYDYSSKKDAKLMAQGREHYLTVFLNAPGYQRQFVASGLKIYRYLADNAESAEMKQKYLDTLMLVYKKLIDCYDKDWYYQGRMGYDMMKYTPDDHEGIKNTFKKAIELGGNSTEYFVLYPYMRLLGEDYKNDSITKEEIFEEYERVVNIIEHNIDKDYLSSQYQQTLESIQAELKNIGVLDCESMKGIYGEKLRETPDDTALIQKTYSTIKSFGKSCTVCDSSFVKYWKKLFHANPNIELARELAQCEMEIGSPKMALKYFDKAIDIETDSAKKADLAYKAGLLLEGQIKDYPKAREYAYKALGYRPDWGKPYILIGRLYASSGSRCGKGTGWNSQIVVWAAFDKWQKAKRIDPSVADEADKLMNEFAQYMPSTDQIFNRALEEGDSYEVKCWIQETTTVRKRP